VLPYESPMNDVVVDVVDEPWISFITALLPYAVALSYAAYCRYTRGNPVLQWGWSGIRVICYR
jgi:hypothetical protein